MVCICLTYHAWHNKILSPILLGVSCFVYITWTLMWWFSITRSSPSDLGPTCWFLNNCSLISSYSMKPSILKPCIESLDKLFPGKKHFRKRRRKRQQSKRRAGKRKRGGQGNGEGRIQWRTGREAGEGRGGECGRAHSFPLFPLYFLWLSNCSVFIPISLRRKLGTPRG